MEAAVTVFLGILRDSKVVFMVSRIMLLSLVQTAVSASIHVPFIVQAKGELLG